MEIKTQEERDIQIEKLNKIEERIKREVSLIFARYTTSIFNVCIYHIDTRYISGEISFNSFGSSFTFEYKFKEQKFYMNCGTIGAYSKDETEVVKRTILMGKIWENIDSVEKSFKNIYIKDYIDLEHDIRKFNQQEEDKQYVEQCKRREDLRQSLKVGNKYFDPRITDFDGIFEITKITPKRVYYIYHWNHAKNEEINYSRRDYKDIEWFVSGLYFNTLELKKD